MMDMTMRPLRTEEWKYTYAQSQQIMMQTGAIGHLRGDFDSNGTGFFTTWFDEMASRKTDEFKREFDEVINALRFDKRYGGLLASRSAMEKCGSSQPASAFEGNYTTEYGFRISTDNFVYLLRCIPLKRDYNFYCWCFSAKFFDRHLRQAERGIRFIDPFYKELFRVADGDKIRVIQSDGTHDDYTCRYIDEYHLEVNSGFDKIYHICEFAEMMERNGSTVIPLRSSLPLTCFSVLPSTGEMIVLIRGETGYKPAGMAVQGKSCREGVDLANDAAGVTRAQEAAMFAGAMYGWTTPSADPENYDENGRPICHKYNDRENGR